MQQENERSLRCKEFVANQSKRKAPLSVPSLQASSLPVSLRAQSLSQGETLGSQLDTLSHSFLSSTPTPFPPCQIYKLRFCFGLYISVLISCPAQKPSPLAMPQFIPRPGALTLIFGGQRMQTCIQEMKLGEGEVGTNLDFIADTWLDIACLQNALDSVSIIYYKGACDSHLCLVKIEMYPLEMSQCIHL